MKPGRLSCLALLAALAARPAAAVEGARWLLAPEGVRSAALANAVTSLQASPEQAWSNPAGLAGIDGVEAGFSRLNYAGGWDADHLTLAAPFQWRHHVGLLYHRNAAQDTLRDNLGNESGTFEVSQSALVAAYAYKGAGWRLGASLKSLGETIQAKNGGGLAYDLGWQGDFANERVILGAAVQNLGAVPDLGGPSIEAPLQLRGGSGLRFSGDVSTFDLLVDYRFRPVTGRNNVSLGAEYSEKYLDGRLGVRAGWDLGLGELGSGGGFSAGLGLGIGAVGLDYAWTPRGDLGTQHRVALNLLWDLRARAREQALEASIGPVSAAPDVLSAAPTPTPDRSKGFVESNVGARLDDLLAATPTPLPTPTPEVQAARPPAKGILGFFANIFGGRPEKSDDEPVAEEEKGGILRGMFRFLGLGGGGGGAPVAAPDSPERAEEDAFDSGSAGPTPAATPTALPMQRLKGDSDALPKATPTAVPVKEKVKDWMKF